MRYRTPLVRVKITDEEKTVGTYLEFQKRVMNVRTRFTIKYIKHIRHARLMIM